MRIRLQQRQHLFDHRITGVHHLYPQLRMPRQQFLQQIREFCHSAPVIVD
jgi:hypothetical protein